jgi:hypothetical protein
MRQGTPLRHSPVEPISAANPPTRAFENSANLHFSFIIRAGLGGYITLPS